MKTGADGGGCFPTGRHYPGIAHLMRVVAAGLVDELSGDTPMTDIALVAIDTETTGRDPAVDRIVEIACVVWKNSTIVARHAWLVNPERPIPKEVFDIHGISDEDVRDKPPFAGIVPELFEALAGSVPLAYNAEFDHMFVQNEVQRAGHDARALPPALRKGVEWVDPLVWARELQKAERSKTLGEVCSRLGIEIGQAHRATDDAEAALGVLLAFSGDARVPKTYAAFIQEQRRLSRLFEQERARWRNRSS